MARRYSGDVEVRLKRIRAGSYSAAVSYGGRRPLWFALPGPKGEPTPKDYDRLAARAVEAAIKKGKSMGLDIRADVRGGSVRVRRLFVAPCST